MLNKMSNMQFKFGEQFVTGAEIGLVGMGLSSLSQELIGHKLGYRKIGLKNGFKIIMSSGLTTILVMNTVEYINKKWKE